MKILILDDERMALEDARRCVKQALEIIGQNDAEIFSSQSWEEIIDAARKDVYDVAFLDMRVPGTNGLELGKELKVLNPRINLIYITAYDQYAVKANSLHISGYLLKPVEVQDIVEELRFLRYEVTSQSSQIRIKCFGNFEVFYQEEPIRFRRQKTKELFAFLVDRHGSSATADEICASIFEDDANDASHKNTLRVLSMELKQILEKCNLKQAYIHTRNAYSLSPDYFECDYYRYLNGEEDLYKGKYMEQYSYWAYFS